MNSVAESVAQKRYYRRDIQGNIVENWEGLCERVVGYVCGREVETYKSEILSYLLDRKFLPNSPCLVNAGTNVGGLLACFVTTSPEDSWIGMIECIKNFGFVAKRGGGCGVDFSTIRPEGDIVAGSTHWRACGPISHMLMISEAMARLTQGGFRGMANMGVLRVDHPDILKFIRCKQRENALQYLLKEDIFNHFAQLNGRTHKHLNIVLDKFISNFNISVMVTDEFMKKVETGEDYDLVFGGKVYDRLNAKRVFEEISENAYRNGDPGLLFYDAWNEGPYKHSGQVITASNPCGEQGLPGPGCCNLGSIDVSKFCLDGGDLDWAELRNVIRAAVTFLDNVIDVNKYPTKEFEVWAINNRPIGLGVMGWADLLLRLEVPYGSKKSLVLADMLMKFFLDESSAQSLHLAELRGTPECCKYEALKYRRNVTLLSIAPTGSISLLADCSQGIEPVFSSTTFRADNTGRYEMKHESYDKEYFRCALDESNPSKEVTYEEHVRMQAAFQKYVDSGVSKTINLPSSASVEDVRNSYLLAWNLGCKGITIYRNNSKTAQVLSTKDDSWNTVEMNGRPEVLPADIFKATANGLDWYIIVGKLGGNPYELFAIGQKVILPDCGSIVRKKNKHYSLYSDTGNLLVENLVDAEMSLDSTIDKETRRFSLELRHGIHPKLIVNQIDKSNDVITSFVKAVSRVFKTRYVDCGDLTDIICPSCLKEGKTVNMHSESGCYRCAECSYSKCG